LVAHTAAINEALDARTATFADIVDTRTASSLQNLRQPRRSAFVSSNHASATIADAMEARGSQVMGLMSSGVDTMAGHVVPLKDIQGNLEFNVSALASDIGARVAQFENLLDTRVEAAANRVTTSGQHAADVIGSRSDELALTIKSRSGKPSGC
jgi:uncharacterized protein YceH (UPF0502 family)